MSRALTEITAHVQRLGLKGLRIVRVAEGDLASSFECKHLERVGYYFRPVDPVLGNFLTKATSSGDRVTDAPYYYLGNSIEQANTALTQKCEWIADEIELLGAGVPKEAELAAPVKETQAHSRRRS